MKSNTKYFPRTSKIKFDLESIRSNKPLDEKEISIIKLLNDTYSQELFEYIKREIYFPGCQSDKYFETYSDRLKEYREHYPDKDEFNFVTEELRILKAIGFDEIYYNFGMDLDYDPHRDNLRTSSKKIYDTLLIKVIEDLDGGLNLTNKYASIFFLESIPEYFREMAYWNFEPTRLKYKADISTLDGFDIRIPIKDQPENKPKAEIKQEQFPFFPKSHRLVQEVTKLGLKKTKQLYQTDNLHNFTNETFDKEYRNYLDKGKYFPGCTLKIYQANYRARLEKYLKTYPDADEFEFLREEEATTTHIIDMDPNNKINFYPFYKALHKRPHQVNLKMSANKIRSFIDERIKDLGHGFQPIGCHDPLDIPNLPRQYWEPYRNPNIVDIPKIEKPEINKTNTISKPIKSLKWLNNQDFTELNNIHASLKENGYIDCDLRTFKKLFENREDFSPVEWNNTATSLIYFIGQLIELKKAKSNGGKWETLKHLFICEKLEGAASTYSKIKNDNKNFTGKSFLDSLIK